MLIFPYPKPNPKAEQLCSDPDRARIFTYFQIPDCWIICWRLLAMFLEPLTPDSMSLRGGNRVEYQIRYPTVGFPLDKDCRSPDQK